MIQYICENWSYIIAVLFGIGAGFVLWGFVKEL